MPLKLFSFFHLNLAYSAIEEGQRGQVIERCYWPLLRLAKDLQLPFGIEASAWTLETIRQIDPTWLMTLRELVSDGPCEFIGCGYAQVIGPLVPAAVNAANLRLGMQRYEDLLGLRPKVALVNEQAYSSGLVPIYQEAGYEALIMEWNNPARVHSDWDAEWRYLPQFACGPQGEALPLIWNKSISFQKFQRYVHGEIELDEYVGYVLSHSGENIRAFPLYGNDVEVFDFRPGRYMTEAPLHGDGEWQRIRSMYEELLRTPEAEHVAPREVLELMNVPGGGNRLELGDATQPVPVKKQDKYNLLRWAATGRDDTAINTLCWKIFDAIQGNENASDSDWAELLYLWSSDFRTHITESRWEAYSARLATFADRWTRSEPAHRVIDAPGKPAGEEGNAVTVERKGRFVEIRGARLSVRLNCQRGLALDSVIDAKVAGKSLFGTLHHGYYDDIQWSADYYSGHLIFESPGRPKVTDLEAVDPRVEQVPGGVCVSGRIPTPLGIVEKRWWIDEARGRLVLSYWLHWDEIEPGSLRLGHITVNPELFDERSLMYATHNGGVDLERFPLNETDFDHGTPVSFLISANQAIGMTEGVVGVCDNKVGLKLGIEKTQIAAVGLVAHRRVRDTYFCRLAVSIQELDDTCRGKREGPIAIDMEINFERMVAVQSGSHHAFSSVAVPSSEE